MSWVQRQISLSGKKRGFHLITDEIRSRLPELKDYKIGLAHIFIQHTTASLALNENADPTLRRDLERHFNQLAPDSASYYRHTMEGSDGMPAHIKAVLLGESVTVLIRDGRFFRGICHSVPPELEVYR